MNAEWTATPTMSEFMLSDKYVRVLAGPVGGGKSVCCAHELMRMAIGQAPDPTGTRRTRFIVVRNTADQLRSTTAKTIQDWFPTPSPYGVWVATTRTLHYRFALADKTIVETEWMLRALDTPEDIRNALSLEATAMWGNECRELHPDVVKALLKRTNRFPSLKLGGVHATRAGGIFDTNMPTLETWWEQRMSTPPSTWSVHIQPQAVLLMDEYLALYDEDPPPRAVATSQHGDVYVVNPLADNIQYLAPDYYTAAVAEDKKDDINTYLRCRYGRSLSGLPVYDDTFKEHHIAKDALKPAHTSRYPIYIGADAGRTPAAIFVQNQPSGRTFVLDELCETNMGMQRFAIKISEIVQERFPGIPCVIAPDPAMWIKGQGEDKAPVDYLKEAGFEIVRPQTNKPIHRIEAVDRLLMASIDGAPRLQIDKRCKTLIGGFRGGYKWATDRAGDMKGEKEPVKNHPWSDIHDGFQYVALTIDGAVFGNTKNSSRKRTVEIASAAGWA